VPVIIAIKQDVPAFLGLAHHHLGGVEFGAEFAARRHPLPVQVEATQTASVVADDHAIWIQHWDDFEHEIVAQVPRSLIV